MAYNNKYFYDRDKSVDSKFHYIYDFSTNFDSDWYFKNTPDLYNSKLSAELNAKYFIITIGNN
jgi:hypothetical protein